ncbi:UNVERIFIED_ORG: hypothetical protein GGE63_000092 [Rhizobium esperanzae]
MSCTYPTTPAASFRWEAQAVMYAWPHHILYDGTGGRLKWTSEAALEWFY